MPTYTEEEPREIRFEVLELFFSERLGMAVEKTRERPPEKRSNTHPKTT